MSSCRLVASSALLASLLLSATPARSTEVLVRHFEFPADRLTLTEQDGSTLVAYRGGVPEFRAGRPELPWVSEQVELPAGRRVVSMEILSVDTEPLSARASVPSAFDVKPGLGPFERSARDPRFFGSALQPERAVELGMQGSMRGVDVAMLRICPVRWNPSSGELVRVRSVDVRIALEPAPLSDLHRERIVPEWESDARDGRAGVARSATAARAEGAAPARGTAPFRATQIPSLEGSPVEYVIITDEAQQSEYQRLADWKTSCGVPAVVRTLSFIQSEYPYGSDDAERIRMFIRDAYTRWGTKWVLLGGDTDVLPTRFPYTTYYFAEGAYIPSDLYYSCLDGNWNADGDSLFGEGYFDSSAPGDSCDLMPDVYVGRAPTVTSADANLFVNKTLQYEKTPLGDYEKTMLFFAEVLFPQDWNPSLSTWLDGAELIEYDLLPELAGRPDLKYTRLYENYLDARWLPGAKQETRKAVRESLSVGYNIAVHVGHGYRNVMSVGDDNLSNSDAIALTNGNRLTNLYAINCTSNAIDFPSIGEAFLHAPNGGAVTNIGSTTLDFPYAGRAYQADYFKLLFQDSVTTIGEAQAKQKLAYVGYSETDNVHRWTQMTLLLLGDPELRIWTGTPRTLSVTRPASIAASDSQFTVHVAIGATPLYGARVTAWKPGADYAVVTTNGAGDALVPFRPDATGSFTLTVTGFDCRPYQATVPVTAATPPVLALNAAIVVDNGLGGTAGNSDQKLDAGEIADLRIPVTNNGGTAVTGVVGTLATTDPAVTITVNSVSYGALATGATSNPASGFRVSIPVGTQDQHEVAFTLTLIDAGGGHTVRNLQEVLHAPEPRSFSHTLIDVGGNSNGRPDAGETLFWILTVRNMGTGVAHGVSARLRSANGLATVLDSVATFGDLAPGQEAAGDAVSALVSSLSAALTVVLRDQNGELDSQKLDLVYPDVPIGLASTGAASTIKLVWHLSSAADLRGYFVYRSLSSGGPFARVNPVPTGRVAYYLDEGLSPLTRYYYRVASVDTSGNESSLSPVSSSSTNPPHHGIFPIPMGKETASSVAIDHLYPGFPIDIVAGSDVLYVWHHDGSAPVDADGGGSTSGDFTRRGARYDAAPAIGDLDHDGIPEIVAASWDSSRVYTFDLAGNVRPGWPLVTADGMWSSPALGDLDNDGTLEMAIGTNGKKFYVMRANGQEWMNGDGDASTLGVFKVINGYYNFGTPALADLDGNGQLDIIFGGGDGLLYAWRPNGTNLPGFPVNLGSSISASPAVGYLDGPGDTELDIVIGASNDSLYVIRANGARRAGFPKHVVLTGTSRSPSPALADMNRDGYLDIVSASELGTISVFNRDGTLISPFVAAPYSSMTQYATQCSPVVADINGDMWPDVLMGDESGQLAALSGADGQMLPGFPIQLGGEVRGSPAVCDCDGDGMTEIVLSGWDKNLYMWDYDFPFSPGGPPPWPQFHHDARRTGLFSTPAFVDVADGNTDAALPAQVAFAAPAPNPARGFARFQLAIPADAAGQPWELGVFDLSGRRVQSVARGTAKPGRMSLEWNLRDAGGSTVGEGVYFVRFSLGATTRSQKLVVLR